jgi:hypothetical protein
MIIVKATADSEAGEMPEQALLEEMVAYHEELAAAGMLIDGTGLKPTSENAWRVDYDGDQRTVTDGPFAETKELIAGYTLIQADSLEQAREWIMRFPNPAHRKGRGQIEVRQLFELEDFGPSEAIDRFEELDRTTK